MTSLECQLKRLCGQYDSNCLDMSRTNNENCCQDTTENYELVCQQLKNKELLLESAQNQMKNDTKCHLFDSQITTLEKQILDYTNKLEMISKLSGLQTEKEKLTKSISDLKIRVNSSEFIEKKKQLSTDLDTSSATGLIGVALVVKENYLTSKSKEFTGMKADEESLKKYETELSKICSKIKDIEQLMNTHQNFSSLLTQSKQLLEATKTEKNNYIARRKSELQISELEDAVLKLKQKKNTLENIEKNKVKLGKLQNENSRIETEIYQVRSSILLNNNWWMITVPDANGCNRI